MPINNVNFGAVAGLGQGLSNFANTYQEQQKLGLLNRRQQAQDAAEGLQYDPDSKSYGFQPWKQKLLDLQGAQTQQELNRYDPDDPNFQGNKQILGGLLSNFVKSTSAPNPNLMQMAGGGQGPTVQQAQPQNQGPGSNVPQGNASFSTGLGMLGGKPVAGPITQDQANGIQTPSSQPSPQSGPTSNPDIAQGELDPFTGVTNQAQLDQRVGAISGLLKNVNDVKARQLQSQLDVYKTMSNLNHQKAMEGIAQQNATSSAGRTSSQLYRAQIAGAQAGSGAAKNITDDTFISAATQKNKQLSSAIDILQQGRVTPQDFNTALIDIANGITGGNISSDSKMDAEMYNTVQKTLANIGINLSGVVPNQSSVSNSILDHVTTRAQKQLALNKAYMAQRSADLYNAQQFGDPGMQANALKAAKVYTQGQDPTNYQANPSQFMQQADPKVLQWMKDNNWSGTPGSAIRFLNKRQGQ